MLSNMAAGCPFFQPIAITLLIVSREQIAKPSGFAIGSLVFGYLKA
jgi:hypothetical protein